MDAARKVLLFDSLLGSVWMVTGLSFVSPARIVEGWWLVGIAGICAAGGLAAEEHGYTPADSLAWFAVAVVGVLGAGIVAVVATTRLFAIVPVTAISAILVGIGVGVLAYRFVYGVVRPIPADRLERADRRAV